MGKISFPGICLIILLTAISAAALVSIENIRKLNIAETELWDPVLSPDGTKIAYAAYDDAHSQQIFVINADGTDEKKLTNDTLKKWGLAWGPDKIAYVSYGKDGLEKIFVMNPDGTDNRQLILDDTRQGNPEEGKPPAWAAPSWSPDGKFLVYTSLDEMQNPKIYMVNADGTGKRLVFSDDSKQWSPSMSPDGKNIVYVSYNNIYREELFIVDVEGTTKRQLTFDGIKKNYPVWGSDGTITYVSYKSLTSSGQTIFAINQDGTNSRVFVDTDYNELSPSFSRDGSRFAYAGIDISGIVKIAIGDTVGLTATPSVTTPAATIPEKPTPAGTTPIATKTAHPVPTATETPAGMGNVLWTMFLILAIIVIVLVALLLIGNVLSKK